MPCGPWRGVLLVVLGGLINEYTHAA